MAAPDISAATGKTQVKRVYVVRGYLDNQGKVQYPITDNAGNTYQFSNYVVKDTYYSDKRNPAQKILKRRLSVTIQVSGSLSGTVSIVETQQFRQYPGWVLQNIRSNQTISEVLTQGKESGSITQNLNFRFNTLATPPIYDNLFSLPTGYSFRSLNANGNASLATLSGSLCLSSQPNQPCPGLAAQSVAFRNPNQLGWEIEEKYDSLPLTGKRNAGTCPNVSLVNQWEPNINLQYSTNCPSGASQCLTYPSSGLIFRRVKTWVSEGIGVIKYQGPFYVTGRTIEFQLRRNPAVNGKIPESPACVPQ